MLFVLQAWSHQLGRSRSDQGPASASGKVQRDWRGGGTHWGQVKKYHILWRSCSVTEVHVTEVHVTEVLLNLNERIHLFYIDSYGKNSFSFPTFWFMNGWIKFHFTLVVFFILRKSQNLINHLGNKSKRHFNKHNFSLSLLLQVYEVATMPGQCLLLITDLSLIYILWWL